MTLIFLDDVADVSDLTVAFKGKKETERALSKLQGLVLDGNAIQAQIYV